MKKILDGIVVLDLTRFFSGPQCTLLLAGLGAEVIKIDDPRTGDPTAFAPPFAGAHGVSFEQASDTDMGLAYLKRARGKKSMTLDLKSERGRQLFLQMAKHADVIVENFSVGVAERLGIGNQQVLAVNPAIVYCSLTGYGVTGSDRHARAYDLMVQAAVGLMTLTGAPDYPPAKAATPLSDAIAGVFAAQGILAALLHRERTGEGQAIDVSMADCLFSLIFDEPIDCYERLGLSTRQGNRIMRFSPFNVYPAKNGWVSIGVVSTSDWRKLVDIIDCHAFRDDVKLLETSARIAINAEIDETIGLWTRQHDRDEIIRQLNLAGIPCSLVRSIDEVMQWQQLYERKMIVPLLNPLSGEQVDASGPGFPIKFSRTPAEYGRHAPVPGSHSDEVLGQFAGLSADDIAQLRRDGIV